VHERKKSAETPPASSWGLVAVDIVTNGRAVMEKGLSAESANRCCAGVGAHY
jgi:hypothetical protein